MTFSLRRSRLLAVVLSGVPLVAGAHDGGAYVTGFAAGLVHPLTGLDHVLAMVALGAWAAFVGGTAMWRLPLAFVLAMVLGGALGLAGVALPVVEAGIALAAIVLGAVVLFELRTTLIAGGLIGAVAGLLHGLAHGTELPAGSNALAYCGGFLLCTAVLHVVGLMLGSSLRDPSVRPLLRSAGAVVAGSGLLFVWPALA